MIGFNNDKETGMNLLDVEKVLKSKRITWWYALYSMGFMRCAGYFETILRISANDISKTKLWIWWYVSDTHDEVIVILEKPLRRNELWSTIGSLSIKLRSTSKRARSNLFQRRLTPVENFVINEKCSQWAESWQNNN